MSQRAVFFLKRVKVIQSKEAFEMASADIINEKKRKPDNRSMSLYRYARESYCCT